MKQQEWKKKWELRLADETAFWEEAKRARKHLEELEKHVVIPQHYNYAQIFDHALQKFICPSCHQPIELVQKKTVTCPCGTELSLNNYLIDVVDPKQLEIQRRKRKEAENLRNLLTKQKEQRKLGKYRYIRRKNES